MGECIDDFQKMGRYTVLICVLCELIVLLQAGNLMFMVFGGAPPTLIGCEDRNDTAWLHHHDLCELYQQRQCIPIIEYQFHSVNVEFAHLCSEGKRIKDSTSYQMIGYMVGAIVFGQVSDTFGRKWPMFVCVLMTGVMGWVSSFATSLTWFTLWRTLLSFFNTGHIVIVMVYMCEKFPRHHRMWLNFVFSWSPNLMFASIIAYYSVDWRTFSRSLNTLAFIATVLLYFCEESIYWLVRKGRVEEAEKAMKRIYRINREELDVKSLQLVLQQEKQQFEAKKSTGSYFFHHLFCTWRLMGYSFTMILSYFAVSIINYGIMFNMEHLEGSIFFNTIFIGCFRYVLNVVSAAVDYNYPKIGRKTAHMFFSAYTVVAIAIALAIEMFDIEALNSFVRYLVMSAGSMVAQIYVVNGVTCSEIYPTAVRNIAYATTQISGSIGSILGPQLFHLQSIFELLPYLVMLALQFGETFCLTVLVPESKGRPMADSMPEANERFRLCRPKVVIEDKDIQKVSRISPAQIPDENSV